MEQLHTDIPSTTNAVAHLPFQRGIDFFGYSVSVEICLLVLHHGRWSSKYRVQRIKGFCEPTPSAGTRYGSFPFRLMRNELGELLKKNLPLRGVSEKNTRQRQCQRLSASRNKIGDGKSRIGNEEGRA